MTELDEDLMWEHAEWEHPGAGNLEQIRTNPGRTHWKVAYRDFVNWLKKKKDIDLRSDYTEEDREMVKNSYKRLYKGNSKFEETIEDKIVLVDKGGGVIEDCDVEDEDGEVTFDRLEEVGIVDGDDVDLDKLGGLIIKYSKEVDKIVGETDEFNMRYARDDFHNWVIGKIGNEWTNFLNHMNGQSLVRKVFDFMPKKDNEFKQRLEYKYVYDKEEDIKSGGPLKSLNSWSDTYGSTDTMETEIEETSIDYNFTGKDVVQGDSREVIDELANEGKVIDAIICDPPYGRGETGLGREGETLEGGDNVSQAARLTEEVMKKARMCLKKGSPVLVFTDEYTYPDIETILRKWYTFEQCLIWNKQHISLGSSGEESAKWRRNHEFIAFATRGGYVDGGNTNANDGTVLSFQRLGGGKMEHPTQKPLSVMKYLVESVTQEGDVVLDPFAGSGSTVVAADRTGRGYVGIEYEDEYVDIIEKRLSQRSLVNMGGQDD